MQVFEVTELNEFPYMEMKEVVQGQSVGDIINDTNTDQVFLLVDHDTKSIWTYNGPHSPFKVQLYGGILAGMLRQQLRLFYRVYPLNMYSKEDIQFQELIQKQIGGGRAKPVEKSDFPEPTPDTHVPNISVSNPKINQVLEYVNEIPYPNNLLRRFMIIGGTIYTDEEITESFLKEEKIIINPAKLGRLNNGFTFFQDHNYSTRLIIKERNIQAIELYIDKEEKSPSIKIEIPIIQEDKFSKMGSIDKLINAFHIPKKLPEESESRTQNDSIN